MKSCPVLDNLARLHATHLQADYLVACVQLQRTQVVGRIRREDSEPEAGAAAIKAQIMLQPGKFRIISDKLACQLLVIDEAVEEGASVRPPPSFTPRPSAFLTAKWERWSQIRAGWPQPRRGKPMRRRSW